MGGARSKQESANEVIEYTFFNNSESMFHSLEEMESAVERSECQETKSVYTLLRLSCGGKVAMDRKIEAELEDLMKKEVETSEKYRDNVEQLRSDLASKDPQVLKDCFENVSDNVPRMILARDELKKHHTLMEETFSVLQTRLRKEFVEKIVKKVRNMDFDDLSDLYNYLDPPPGRIFIIRQNLHSNQGGTTVQLPSAGVQVAQEVTDGEGAEVKEDPCNVETPD